MGKALSKEVNEPLAILYVEAETVMEKVRCFQCNEQELAQLMNYLEKKILPVELHDAKRVIIQTQKNFM